MSLYLFMHHVCLPPFKVLCILWHTYRRRGLSGLLFLLVWKVNTHWFIFCTYSLLDVQGLQHLKRQSKLFLSIHPRFKARPSWCELCELTIAGHLQCYLSWCTLVLLVQYQKSGVGPAVQNFVKVAWCRWHNSSFWSTFWATFSILKFQISHFKCGIM